MNSMLMDSIIEVFYHLNNILIVMKHIANNNFLQITFFLNDAQLLCDLVIAEHNAIIDYC